jgi:hypothetical protein
MAGKRFESTVFSIEDLLAVLLCFRFYQISKSGTAVGIFYLDAVENHVKVQGITVAEI